MSHCTSKIMEVLSMAPSSATCRSAHRLTNTLPRRRLLTRRSRTTELCVAKAGDQQQINASRLLDPTQVASIPVSLDRALPIAIAAVAGISWYLLKQVRRGKQKQRVRSPGSAEFDAALEVSSFLCCCRGLRKTAIIIVCDSIN